MRTERDYIVIHYVDTSVFKDREGIRVIDICEISLCGLRCGPLECVLVLVLQSDACRVIILSHMSFSYMECLVLV